MSNFFETTFKIDSRDVDTFGLCRPSSLLAYLQEVGNLAAEHISISREEMLEKYNCFWMLARIWYRLDKPIGQFDQITFQTWHRGNKGAILYRDYDIYREGERIGEAVSAWIVADWDTRKILRLSTVLEVASTSGGTLCKELTLRRLKMPENMTLAQERTVCYSELDINGHVNNTKYADYICDAMQMEKIGRDYFISTMQIGYEAECRAGETLRMFLLREDEQCCVRGDDPEGKNRFESMVIFSPRPQETGATDCY